MKTIKLFLYLLIAVCVNCAYAVPVHYVCPKTYQTVLGGDSMTKVAKACGKPTSVTTQKKIEIQPVELKQWVYTGTKVASRTTNQFTPQLLITFKDNKVIRISTNNESASKLFTCYSMQRINIGDSTNEVMLQCGKPRSVNTIQQGMKKPVTITTWTYNFGAFKPTMIFTFKNDSLTNIRMGPLGK